MATKKYKTPAVRYLRYELTNSSSAGTETSHYIDLARDLSAINRRLYRQGRCYHVKRVSVVSSNTIAGFGVGELIPGTGLDQEIVRNAGRITFATAPDSWMVRNGWKRGFEMYRKMQKKAMAGIGSDISGTWEDFKVYLTNDMRTGTKLTPLDNGGNAVTLGEWTYSEYVSPDGTTSADNFTASLIGPGQGMGSPGSVINVSLTESYALTRATVSGVDPTVPSGASDDVLANLFDDGTVSDEIINNLEGDADEPPYAKLDYAGGSANMPKPLVVQQSTLGVDGRTTVGGFTAVCGLIEIETTSPIADDVYSILVELAPGNYRGVGAEVI